MATMQIHLRNELKARLAGRAAENGFESVEAYVESLLRADAGEQQVADDDLEDLLLRRLDSGAGVEFTPAFAEQFRRQVAQRRQGNGNRS
jgi:hypothetical protein